MTNLFFATEEQKMAGLREISHDEFCATVLQGDVHPQLEGPYPYNAYYFTRNRELKGAKIVERIQYPDCTEVARYFTA